MAESILTQFGFEQSNGSIVAVGGIVPSTVTITERVDSATKWVISFDSTNTSLFEKAFHDVMLSPTPVIYVKTSQHEVWQSHTILACHAIPRISSHTIVLKTGDKLASMNRQSKITSWSGKISSFVERIAKNNGLSSIVEATTDDFCLIQNNISDTEFLQRLVELSRNSSGRTDYRFFIADNKLHFHTVGFAIGNDKSKVKKISGFDGTTSRVSFDDRSQMMSPQGAGGATVITFNPADGTFKLVSSDSPRLKLAKNSPKLESIANVALIDSQTIGPNKAEPEIRAQSYYEHSRLESYTVMLNLTSNLLHVDDLVSLDVTQSNMTTSSWSGLYVVKAATHKIKQGAAASTIVLGRGDVN